jgi:hypothetical protein
MPTDSHLSKKSLKPLDHSESHNYIAVLFSLVLLLSIQALIEMHLSNSTVNVKRMDIARSITR